MRNYHLQNDPARNRQFRRRWAPALPPSPAEAELARLRSRMGNIEGARVFRERVASGEFRL